MRLPERSVPVIERLDADMVAVYRSMTPAQRIVAGLSATDLIRERLLASLRELASRSAVPGVTPRLSFTIS